MSAKISKISDFFSVYKKRIKPPQRSVEKVFREVIREMIGIELDSSNVEYKVSTRNIILHTSGIIKTEIKKQKTTIIKEMSVVLPSDSVPTNII